jgi:imidazolonepropionase-like amidohydrolase
MLAITNGTIHTQAGAVHEGGTILLDGGKIVSVGERLTVPSDATVVDATGKVVMPGFVESHSHVGLWSDGVASEGHDFNETSDPVTPHMRAIDGINPLDGAFPEVLAAGITTLMTGPGSANLFGGEWVALKPVGMIVEEMILRAPCGLKIALGENPKRVYGAQKKSPVTRMGEAALIRETFLKAQSYTAELERAANAGDEPPERDLRLEPLVRAMRGEEKTRIHAHAAQDIVTAVRLAREFGLDVVIEHATEGWKIADFLARENVPVSLGPFHLGRPKIEMAPMTLESPGILARAGVTIAIHMDATSATSYLPVFAGLAVRAGLDEDEALRAITINAARISGIADRVGSLEPGKDADVLVLSGHPFDWRTTVERVYINGELAHTAAGIVA